MEMTMRFQNLTNSGNPLQSHVTAIICWLWFIILSVDVTESSKQSNRAQPQLKTVKILPLKAPVAQSDRAPDS